MKRYLVTFVFALTAAAAQAQTDAPCANRQQMLELLTSKYGESRAAVGLAGTSSMMEIFANPETGTWSAVISTPDGMSCLKASGTDYQAIAPEPTGIPG